MSATDASTGDFVLLGPGLLRRAARRSRLRWPHVRPWQLALGVAAGTWLPLALLAGLQGQLSGPGGSLLRDAGPHVRLLWVAPLLIAFVAHAERELAGTVAIWGASELLPPAGRTRFESFSARISGLHRSVLPHVALAGLAFLLTSLGVEAARRAGVARWLFTGASRGALSLSWAGWWYALVCAPLVNVLALRWLWRLVSWTAFLLRLATLPPRLLGTHADGIGGLDGLDRSHHVFLPLALAVASVEAASLANLIIHRGATFSGLKSTALLAAAVSSIVLLAPLLVFTPQLIAARRRANQRYGAVAARHAVELEEAVDAALTEPPAQGRLTSDLLERDANLAQSFATPRTMRVILVSRSSFALWALATVGPLALLVLTEIPAAQLLDRLRELLL